MNKKIAALLLAASLTTGLGSFGTYAYFTDGAILTDNVNITMGNLDVNAYWATDAGKNTWVVTSGGTEVTSGTSDTLTFENVKPGDTFERDVLIKNEGSLKANIRVQLENRLPEGLTIELKNVTSEAGNVKADPNYPNRWYEDAVSANGGYIKATVKVTVDSTLDNNWMNKAFTVDANKFIDVSAHQTTY